MVFPPGRIDALTLRFKCRTPLPKKELVTFLEAFTAILASNFILASIITG
jgi:hypothetical protein